MSNDEIDAIVTICAWIGFAIAIPVLVYSVVQFLRENL